jgi:hypothetical protein
MHQDSTQHHTPRGLAPYYTSDELRALRQWEQAGKFDLIRNYALLVLNDLRRFDPKVDVAVLKEVLRGYLRDIRRSQHARMLDEAQEAAAEAAPPLDYDDDSSADLAADCVSDLEDDGRFFGGGRK